MLIENLRQDDHEHATHVRRLSDFRLTEKNKLVIQKEEVQTAVDAKTEHAENDMIYTLYLTSLNTHVVRKLSRRRKCR